MSYLPDLSARARTALAALPYEVQEEALDVIDRAVAGAADLVPRGLSPDVVIDLVLPLGGVTHYVFITVRRNKRTRTLHVKSIAHFVKGKP